MSFLYRSPVVIWVADIGRLATDMAPCIDELDQFNIGLRNGMGIKTSERSLIFTFTKADQSAEVRLENTDPRDQGYVDTLHQRSNDIHSIVSRARNGKRFLTYAEDLFPSIRFCAVSATGCGVTSSDDRRLVGSLAPRRILDPLYLTIDGSWMPTQAAAPLVAQPGDPGQSIGDRVLGLIGRVLDE